MFLGHVIPCSRDTGKIIGTGDTTHVLLADKRHTGFRTAFLQPSFRDSFSAQMLPVRCCHR
ncbi:hypothetical protein MESS4_110065 [Mesorhizobium sp. STM 4661]|nr:hypothetical protein MESS4_110065 [Mesorhizobium sp. STM 4661]